MVEGWIHFNFTIHHIINFQIQDYKISRYLNSRPLFYNLRVQRSPVVMLTSNTQLLERVGRLQQMIDVFCWYSHTDRSEDNPSWRHGRGWGRGCSGGSALIVDKCGSRLSCTLQPRWIAVKKVSSRQTTSWTSCKKCEQFFHVKFRC